jgi:hypothetical protein
VHVPPEEPLELDELDDVLPLDDDDDDDPEAPEDDEDDPEEPEDEPLAPELPDEEVEPRSGATDPPHAASARMRTTDGVCLAKWEGLTWSTLSRTRTRR